MKLGRLVTPSQNKTLPIYSWYNYKHSFSRDLIIYLIKKFKLTEKAKILDPFCGSGTTLVASKELGILAYGLDILPLSVFITNAKLYKYNKKIIEDYIKEFEKTFKIHNRNNLKLITTHNNEKELLKNYFQEDTIDKILAIKNWIQNTDNKQIKYFFLTALLSILESVSYTKKDGAFLRIDKNKMIYDIIPIYLLRLKKMLLEVEILNALPQVKAKAFLGDARRIPFKSSKFSAVITSPPYPNRHDYTRIYLLELLIGFIDNLEDIKTLRYSSIRSHVEAKIKIKANKDYIMPDLLKVTLEELENTYLPNRTVIKMLKGYFEDMHIVLKEIYRVLKPNGKVAFIIGDVRYGGIKIPVTDIIVEIARNIGFEFDEKITARLRGNSPQQMKKYGKVPLEENILIWQRK